MVHPAIASFKRKMTKILELWGRLLSTVPVLFWANSFFFKLFFLCFMMNNPLARLETRRLGHLHKLPETGTGCSPDVKIGANCVAFWCKTTPVVGCRISQLDTGSSQEIKDHLVQVDAPFQGCYALLEKTCWLMRSLFRSKAGWCVHLWKTWMVGVIIS